MSICFVCHTVSDSLHPHCYINKGALLEKFQCFHNFQEIQESMDETDYTCSFFWDYLKCVRSAAVKFDEKPLNCTDEMALASFQVADADIKPFTDYICGKGTGTLKPFEDDPFKPFEDGTFKPFEEHAQQNTELDDTIAMAGVHRSFTHSLLIGCVLLAAWVLVSSQLRW